MFTTIQSTDHTSPKMYIYSWDISKSSTTIKVTIVSAKDRDYDSTDPQDTTSLPNLV